jgi:predicted TIM-barrel fold metal-dependent hydrolase
MAAAAPSPSRILDAHTHFYDPGRPQGVPWPDKTDSLLYRRVLPPDFVRLTRPLGVAGTIVIEASAWLEDNQWILDLARDQQVIAGFVGHLDAGVPEFRAHLDRFRKNPFFRGIRLNGSALVRSVAQAQFLDDIRRLADYNLELDAIGDGSMFAALARITDHAPDLRVVVNHLPFPSDPDFKEIAGRRRIYAKVSGMLPDLRNRRKLDAVWQAFGADRVLYGSNWPVSDKQGPYKEVLEAVTSYFSEKGAAVLEKYFWKNAAAAYNVKFPR